MCSERGYVLYCVFYEAPTNHSLVTNLKSCERSKKAPPLTKRDSMHFRKLLKYILRFIIYTVVARLFLSLFFSEKEAPNDTIIGLESRQTRNKICFP